MPFLTDWIPIYPQGIKCPHCESQDLQYRKFQDELSEFDQDAAPKVRYKVECTMCESAWWEMDPNF